MNKAGQEMTLGMIIAIVLGIVALVLLIFGFYTGWGNLWSKITAFGGGSENVATIVQTCALKCSGKDVYGFCEQVRTVNYEDKTWEKGSCNALKTESSKIRIDDCDIKCDKIVPIDSSENPK
jgi:hypothetical protein